MVDMEEAASVGGLVEASHHVVALQIFSDMTEQFRDDIHGALERTTRHPRI